MKKVIATLMLAAAFVGTTGTAAFAKHGADDKKAPTGRIDCRKSETICVRR